MTAFQETLGEDDIAEELAADQRQISIAEFFERNKQMLGFDSEARALVTAVKEAVDNALDATEEAGFLPDIYVEIRDLGDYYSVVVEDNGPGVTAEEIPNVFGKLLYGSRFHKREMNRGQQGIGISAAVLYAQLTSGTPAKVTSRTTSQSTAQLFELIIDTEENEPEIQSESSVSWDRPHGTRIELLMEANMRARQQLHDYITHTAIVNPHARIELVEPDTHLKFDRATDELPDETSAIRPHPHGVELGTLMKLLEDSDSYSLSGFLQGEFTRVGAKTARTIIDAFKDRHFGREMAWSPPESTTDLQTEIKAAVSNKGKQATRAFGDYIISGTAEFEGIQDRSTLTYTDIETIVDEAAGVIETEFDTRFGATVRENAVTAVWAVITRHRRSDLAAIINDATSDRKDKAVLGALAERIGSKFDEVDRDRVDRTQLREFVDRSADMTVERDDATVGDTARNNITDAIWDRMRTVADETPGVNRVARNRDAAANLLDAMRSVDVMAPPTNCLAPIRSELIEEGLRAVVDADFYTAVTRDADVHGGDPFIVEAGIAYGGELDPDGTADIMRFANRVPLVYQQGACAITDVISRIDWRNYELDQPGGSGLPAGAATILVHVASTNVPFTSESKDAVANIQEIEDEIELAVREAARELKSHLNKRRSLEQRRRKQSVILDILPKIADKVATVTHRDPPNVDRSLARIMNNVFVNRTSNGSQVDLRVINNSQSSVDLEVTDIVSTEPSNLSDGSTMEMDGEWFIHWEPSIPSGGSAQLEYTVDGDTASTLDVDGIEEEKLTIHQ